MKDLRAGYVKLRVVEHRYNGLKDSGLESAQCAPYLYKAVTGAVLHEAIVGKLRAAAFLIGGKSFKLYAGTDLRREGDGAVRFLG